MKWRLMAKLTPGMCQMCGSRRHRNMVELESVHVGESRVRMYCVECMNKLGESEGDPRE